MRYDLKGPCENCPFTTGPGRIVFAARSRAEEIEESAYRNGFPCHRSAALEESLDYDDDAGYVPRENGKTQHCMGYILMRMKDDGGDSSPWPGIDNDEDVLRRISKRIEYWKAPVFDSTDDFFKANEGERTCRPTTKPRSAQTKTSRANR